MRNRNLLLFCLLSLALVALYAYTAPRSHAGPPALVAAVPPVSSQAPPEAAPATVTLENAELKVTWRKEDAALVQAVWKADGTRLFPGAGTTAPKGVFALGALVKGGCPGAPVVSAGPWGQQVSFRGAQGEGVTYRLPAQGPVLSVELTAAATLIPVPSGPAIGRIFTLEPGVIHAVPWAGIQKDPFLAFLGARRKELPPTSARLGLDAGGDPAASAATPAFAAIWEVSAVPERNPGGYTLWPEAGRRVSGRLYLGPKTREGLAAFGQPFAKVLDFGFFGPLGQALFWALHQIHGLVANWGWALAIFSFLLRFLLWPLNTRTTLQSLRAKDLEPHQKVIQAKYEQAGGTLARKAEQQKEVMAFYRANGHNPMGGCLPSLVQMPVLFALYGMLGNVFELRHAPWILWLQDLSAPDPCYVLPILLGLCTVAQQGLAPALGDPSQRKLMLWVMPAVMVFMFARLASGLNLYYLTFNLLGLAQTWWLTRTYRPEPVLI